jgi:beta-glucosidase
MRKAARVCSSLPEKISSYLLIFSQIRIAYETLPLLDREIRTADGKPGWTGTFHSTDSNGDAIPDPVEAHYLDETNVFINESYPASLTTKWRFHARGFLPPRESDLHFEFGLTCAGRAKLFIDGKLVVDNWTTQTRGKSFFMQGTVEEKGTIILEAGKEHEVFLEFANDRPDGTLVCAPV